MKKIQKGNLLRAALVFSIAVLLVVVVVFLTTRNHPQPVQPEIETIPTEIPETEQETETETEQPETEEDLYPEPAYSFYIEDVYVVVPGLEREYNIAWVSDLHMISDHEPAEDVTSMALFELDSRYEKTFLSPDGWHADELLPEIIKYLNHENPDALILGGDIIDYCSRKQIDLLKENFAQLRLDPEKILYIRADHDCAIKHNGGAFSQTQAYEMQAEIDGYDPSRIYIDLDELRIIGVNLSYKNISDEDLQYTLDAYETDKPVIAVTHVPYYSTTDTSLAEASMKARNTLYYWGPVSDYVPNENTRKLFEKIYDESDDRQVVQVLAGHLHAPWDGMINYKTPEHIFSPAFSGAIGMVHVVPEKPDTSENDVVSDKETSGNDSKKKTSV